MKSVNRVQLFLLLILAGVAKKTFAQDSLAVTSISKQTEVYCFVNIYTFHNTRQYNSDPYEPGHSDEGCYLEIDDANGSFHIINGAAGKIKTFYTSAEALNFVNTMDWKFAAFISANESKSVYLFKREAKKGQIR